MNAQNTNPELLQTKKHFEILDGLRGVAALAVVTFHFMEMAYTDYSQNFIAHGFLAVDFFFCLSGFVIAYAYDDRIAHIGVIEFFKSRLIRLHPLVILGSILGLLAFMFDPFGTSANSYGTGKLILIFLSSVLMIPYPVMPERAFNLFGLNAPAWSLFWEYVANIFYAFVLYKTGRRWLGWLTMLAAAGICIVAYRSDNLLGGWAGSNFWDGCARISYSFLAGMLIYRSNWIIKNRLGFPGLTVLLVVAFIMPFSAWNWLTEPLVVLFYFPLLIALGAGSVLSTGLKRLCVFSGKISYPLYMTHYAALWIFMNYYTAYKPGTAKLSLIIITAIILLISVAWLVMLLYDNPLRKYLNRKRNSANQVK
ncbi:acyltransferase family protein [Mucilaginibacter segetis]|uniref:Acyltransferase n=1 Tax=Mucilaginibacter segetis TaxID=2793071 RepID=A0A934PU93_9SPHI|nr:acyltransferase [Mucilaginibacter segetis]MBK0379652.1 acyltransferase [Mucilaginibacter segetis]